ncbi:MAG: HlyC/CorC family transporter [Clostridia bacterium]|nr:HlyC/CorC family transporter [Clostridia bacterium]
MDSGDIGLLVALLVLVVLSGCFSATETAYTSFSTVRMRRYAVKRKSAKLALELSEDYNKVLTTLLIGNNIVNIAGATIATLLFTNLIGRELGPTVSTIALTVVILIFGEVTPKSLAKEEPERFACCMAYPLLVLTWICLPLNWIFGWWKKLVFFVFGLDKSRKTFTEEEFKMLVSDVREEGVLNETEHDLITRTLRYDELHVGSCMIPLERVILAEVRDNDRLVYKIFRETNFSRIPIYKGTKQNIIGILYRADFYENLLAGRRDFGNIIRPVSYTTTDEKVSDLMKRLQAMRESMVIVGSEGNALGLITREDMLEELLGGDIDDKYDLTPVTSPLQPFIPEPEPVNPETVDETEE